EAKPSRRDRAGRRKAEFRKRGRHEYGRRRRKNDRRRAGARAPEWNRAADCHTNGRSVVGLPHGRRGCWRADASPAKNGTRIILMSIFDRLREGLSRTTQQIVRRFAEIVTQSETPERKGRSVDVDTIDATAVLLIIADVGGAATSRIAAAVQRQAPSGTS